MSVRLKQIRAQRIAQEIMRQAGGGGCFEECGRYVVKIYIGNDRWLTLDCDTIAEAAP